MVTTTSSSDATSGIVPRSLDDASLQDEWDTCNNLVISWLMSSVSESIAKSTMFIDTTHVIWLLLETRFALSNGSHKYKLSKETYDTMQSGKSVKESQREVFGSRQLGIESTTLYSKGEIKDKCTICGFKWHPLEKCWEKVGYHTWHYKYKQNQKAKRGMKSGNAPLLKSIPHFNQNDEANLEMRSDHMSPESNDLNDIHVLKNKQVINLPNGHTSIISKVGHMALENKLELKNVLIVPSFKFRLLKVGLGKKVGLYQLLNLPLEQIHAQLSSMVVSALEDFASNPSRVADKFEAIDVIFYELIFPYLKSSIAQVLQPIPAPILSPIWYEDFMNTKQASPQSNAHFHDPIPEPEFEPILVPNTTLRPEATRKSTRVPVQPSWLKDYVTPHHPKANQVSVTSLQNQFHAFLCALVAQTTPTYFKEAVKDVDWCKAMNDELRALEENNTASKSFGFGFYILAHDGLEGVECTLAKVLLLGERAERKGIDYEETFALVAKMVTVKALITVGTMNGWDTCQMDVSNAFLHSDLFEEVYKKMPQGYASRQWFAKLSSTLLSSGFVQSKADYSLFNKSEKFSFTTILVYVDDLLITSSSETEIQALKS
ncbi:retrovirus-related pol polyprotein from transposon TNT 1-94 [Tanacetum coccineum]